MSGQLLLRADSLTKAKRVFVWIDMFPLESIRRVLSLLYADSNSWKFLPCEESPFLKASTWSHVKSDQGKTTFSQHTLCLFLMPPWVLSAKDLQEFTRGQSVCSHPAKVLPEALIALSFLIAPR